MVTPALIQGRDARVHARSVLTARVGEADSLVLLLLPAGVQVRGLECDGKLGLCHSWSEAEAGDVDRCKRVWISSLLAMEEAGGWFATGGLR